MTNSKTRFIPVPFGSIAQCQDAAITELKAAAGSSLPPNWETRERASWAQAQRVGPPGSAALVAVAVEIAKPMIRWFVGKVGKTLQNRVSKYTSVYHAGANFQLYERDVPGPELAYPYFRLSRLVERNSRPVVAFDLLAQLHIVDHEALKIRPLRLFVGEIAAENRGSSVGIAVSLNADAVWRAGRKTHRRTGAIAIDELLTHYIENIKSGLPLYATFWDAKHGHDGGDWNSFPAQPLPPWSSYDNVIYGGSHIALDVTVAEAGDPPWLLRKAAKLFHTHRDEITSLLEKAAEAALDQDRQ